ncbi:hypothetical protein [Pseudomonas syringae pv. coryli]|uniref:hypothetical protein n=1 Tax=Pseudomonas syringae pv. coryli TaxID=317659 RepID=UPI003D2A3D5B
MKALRIISLILVIVIGVPLVSNEILEPHMSRWVSGWEMSKHQYAVAVKEYEQLSPCGRLEVRKLMGKGYLSKGDMQQVITIALKEKGQGASIQVSPAPDYGDAEHKNSSEFLNNLLGKPTDSIAKVKLFDLASTDSQPDDLEGKCR